MEAANLKLVDNMDPLYEVLLGFVNAITSAFCASLAATPDLYMAVGIHPTFSYLIDASFVLCDDCC